VNALGAVANLRLRLEEPKGRRRKPKASRIRQGERTPRPSSKHCRERQAELSCSSRWNPASPSARIDSSSCGSRIALPQSSARPESYMPSPEPQRTLASAGPLRIGAETSLDKNIPRTQTPTTYHSQGQPKNGLLESKPSIVRLVMSRGVLLYFTWRCAA
jgi:hypothetical protein